MARQETNTRMIVCSNCGEYGRIDKDMYESQDMSEGFDCKHCENTTWRMENAAERAKRVGSKRVNKVITDLRLIGNMNTAAYAFTDEQVEMICETLTNELTKALDKIQRVETAEKQDAFSL